MKKAGQLSPPGLVKMIQTDPSEIGREAVSAEEVMKVEARGGHAPRDGRAANYLTALSPTLSPSGRGSFGSCFT